MLFFLYHYEQVAGDAVPACCIAFAADAKLHAFGNAGRYVDGNGFFSALHAAAKALLTLVGNYLSFAAAGRTGRGRAHLADERAGDAMHLPCSFAGVTAVK